MAPDPLDVAPAPAPAALPAPGPLPGEALRRAKLRGARRQASGLLALTALALLAAIVLTDETGTGMGYVVAGLEAALVGGFADWFAVTALFRHPLGIPLPHTAVIVERKDSFAQTLGEFVQDELLTPDAIVERVRAARVTERLADWLSDPDHAAKTAHRLTDGALAVADLLRDEDVHDALETAVRSRVEAMPLAPIAGRALQLLTERGRHQEALDAALKAADRLLREHHGELRERFGREAPWWLPGAVEDRLFDRLLDGARSLIHDVAGDPQHHLRQDLDERIQLLAEQLQTSPELRARGEALKQDLLAQPQLREWVTTMWTDLKEAMRTEADDPDSELRGRLADAIAGLGVRLRDDPALAARIDQAVEAGARRFGDEFHHEIASMVSSTISRWDAHETATRLELLLGPDLQFIRINGTVIGGLAGLAIHAATQAVG
jgi:uncharacterized membrane-anchored protein YjiN (DUF445 family)